MSLPFAINGLGRIGRALVRIAATRDRLDLVAANDIAPAGQLAHLLAHDTLHKGFGASISVEGDAIRLGERRFRVFGESEVSRIPWQETKARVVVDATGKCLTRASASSHRRGAVERVLVSANAKGMDLTLCRGVNDADYDPERHRLVSGASCTTNCLAPVVHLLDREYGLRSGMFNTVHSYNNDQSLLESAHKDPRRARAAALNMIPTTTSAVEALVRVLPGLAGRVDGFAVRVPTPNVSLVDLVAELERAPSVAEINRLFETEAAGALAGVLEATREELVSSDFIGNPHSAIVDLALTQCAGTGENGWLYRVVAWYDNEWGHASRLADILEMIAERDAGQR